MFMGFWSRSIPLNIKGSSMRHTKIAQRWWGKISTAVVCCLKVKIQQGWNNYIVQSFVYLVCGMYSSWMTELFSGLNFFFFFYKKGWHFRIFEKLHEKVLGSIVGRLDGGLLIPPMISGNRLLWYIFIGNLFCSIVKGIRSPQFDTEQKFLYVMIVNFALAPHTMSSESLK